MRLIERIAVYPELDADGAGAEERLEDHGQRCFSAMHACVEKADGGCDLPDCDQYVSIPTDVEVLHTNIVQC